MEYSKQQVVNMLRRAGFVDQVDEAMRELPEHVDLDQLQVWASRHGITRDLLISEMGGSP